MSGFDIRYAFFFTSPQPTEILDTVYSELETHFSIHPTVMTQNYMMFNIILPEQLQNLRTDTEALRRFWFGRGVS